MESTKLNKSLLKTVKANRYTYHNQSQKTKDDFRKRYTYLKRHINEPIRTSHVEMAAMEMNRVELDIVKRLKAIEILSLGIIDKKPLRLTQKLVTKEQKTP